jgi:[protein-PII] uridylyltransferase
LQRTRMEIECLDRPGLLAEVGQAFVDCDVRVQSAKISTFGERVEDTFYITDQHQKMLSVEDKKQLHQALLNRVKSI